MSSCSLAQLFPALCDPMDHSTPGFPSPSPRVCSDRSMSIESAMLSNHFILYSPLLLLPQSFLVSGSFPMSWLFASGGQSIGASTSASVLPMNTQVWFPLGFTDLISLQSKGLSRVFSSTTVWRHQFFCAFTSVHDCFDNMDFCRQSDASAF